MCVCVICFGGRGGGRGSSKCFKSLGGGTGRAGEQAFRLKDRQADTAAHSEANNAPVDGAAVDERREHAQALAERVADGREAQHEVQVGAHAVHEERVDGLLGDGQAGGHHEGAHGGGDLLDIFIREQVGHLGVHTYISVCVHVRVAWLGTAAYMTHIYFPPPTTTTTTYTACKAQFQTRPPRRPSG